MSPENSDTNAEKEQVVRSVQKVRQLLTDFEYAETKGQHAAIKHAIVELRSAKLGLELTTEQCNEPNCARDGVVYGLCVEDAPPSWLNQALEYDQDLLTDEQTKKAKKRLDEAGSSDV